ncbi:hypothetical protein [Actinoplanes sp. NBRC 101535]|uniref:hypothetical protein n=1 Tax=Actinoplanes sp. NBRC 101535 TaxID=3032196 RepID=UPI0025562072|nr:hypothetical protein [Actinoplanes sp. NBRC 101535]
MAAVLAAHLGCGFEERDSDFLGEYLLARIGSGELSVVEQPDPEGEPLEGDFEDYHVLIYSPADLGGREIRDLRVGDDAVEVLR